MLNFIRKDGTPVMKENSETGELEIFDKELKEEMEAAKEKILKEKAEKKKEKEEE